MPPTGGKDSKFAQAKEAAKIFFKRFGPLIVTGLAAVAEHHWLGHEDEDKDESETTRARDRLDEPEERNSVRKLEREVAELKRSLSRKAMGEETRPSPRIREEIVRGWRPLYQEEEARGQHPRGRTGPDEGPRTSNQPYCVVQQTQPLRQEASVQFLQVQERDYIRPSHRPRSLRRRHRHRHQHRHSSVPNRIFHEDDFSDETVHAGKVAAIAGAVEAIHVGDIPGDWIGPKGLRVGTTMAASYAASRSRDRDPDNFRRREVVADVGTGLFVSRLVYGSSRRLEEDERVQRGRRWSYCY